MVPNATTPGDVFTVYGKQIVLLSTISVSLNLLSFVGVEAHEDNCWNDSLMVTIAGIEVDDEMWWVNCIRIPVVNTQANLLYLYTRPSTLFNTM